MKKNFARAKFFCSEKAGELLVLGVEPRKSQRGLGTHWCASSTRRYPFWTAPYKEQRGDLLAVGLLFNLLESSLRLMPRNCRSSHQRVLALANTSGSRPG